MLIHNLDRGHIFLGEYRRWISYVYGYLNGVKGQSAGYVKIESRNGMCKIYTNIKAPYSTVTSIEIYVFYRQDEKMVLVELGTGSMKKGQCEFTYETKEECIGGSNLRLEQLGGLVGIVDENRFFGTVWDEKDIDLNRAIKHGDKEKNSLESTENTIEEIQINDTEDIDNEILLSPEEKHNIEYFEKENVENNEETKQEDKIIIENMNIQETILENETKNETEKEMENCSFIERIFARYPGMYPFEDDEIIECVKLDPQDIGVLPMEKWVLANNSFLLHGYYTYRHLIFAKVRGKDLKDMYILGVPGLYRDRERFMAGMFGFDKFKGVRGTPRDYGEFGYWYMNLDL